MKKYLLALIVPLLLVAFPAGAQETKKINKKNLVIKEWNTDARTNKKVLDHITTFNPEGKKIEEIEYGSSGQKWRKRFEYGADGKVSRELVYDERNKLVNYKKFEYNEFNRKKTQYTYYTADALKRVAEDVACFARKEGLTGHAKSAVIRLEDDEA